MRDVSSYVDDPEKGALEYKANLAAMDQLRQQRRSKGQYDLSFR